MVTIKRVMEKTFGLLLIIAIPSLAWCSNEKLQNVDLKIGDNFISLAGIPTSAISTQVLLADPSIGQVCQSAGSSGTEQDWSCTTRTSGNPFTLQLGKAYLIRITKDTGFNYQDVSFTVPMTFRFIKGYNYAGIPYATKIKYTAYTFLGEVKEAQKIYRLRPGGGWEFAFKMPSGTLTGTNFELKQGEGYMVFVTSNVAWTPAVTE